MVSGFNAFRKDNHGLKKPSAELNILKKSSSRAFTIVELLVVIVVIGILAAITIVSYSGIAQKATVASLQTDLANSSKKLKMYYTLYGSYPITLDVSKCPATPNYDENYCLKASSTHTFTNYASTANTFTLTETSANGTVYTITENSSPYISIPITAMAAIAGLAEVNSILTAGALTPAAATTSYRWQSSATVGGVYSDIPGATASTYALVSGDVNKYIKVIASGVGVYSGTQTSVASAQVTNPWIAGIAATALAGKFVRGSDLVSTMQYKTSSTSVTAPQGATGLDPNFPSNMSLVNPQINSGVDFSAYPAQNACKAVNGRLPNMQELTAIYVDRITYGNNFTTSLQYWSSTDANSNSAWGIGFNGGFVAGNGKTDYYYVRCIKD